MCKVRYPLPKTLKRERLTLQACFQPLYGPLCLPGPGDCSELDDYLRKVLSFAAIPNLCFHTDSLKDFTDSFKVKLKLPGGKKRGETSERHGARHQFRAETIGQHISYSASSRRQTGTRVRDAKPDQQQRAGIRRKVLRVRLFMGPEREVLEAEAQRAPLTRAETLHEQGAEGYGLGRAPGGPVSVGGRFQRGIALPTNANMPSSFCLYLSTKSFISCLFPGYGITML